MKLTKQQKDYIENIMTHGDYKVWEDLGWEAQEALWIMRTKNQDDYLIVLVNKHINYVLSCITETSGK
jgi:hypothetical protein